MKNFIGAAVLALIFTSIVFGQPSANRGIVLTGSVVGVKPGFDCEGDQFVFDVEFYLQFRNESETSLLIFLPQNFFGNSRITYLEPSNANSEKSTTVNPWKKVYPQYFHDSLPYLLRDLGAESPPINRFTVIRSGGSYESRHTLRVTSGYRLEVMSGRKLSEMSAIPEYPAIKIEYHLSKKDLGNSDALEIAKRNWKTIGELPLDSNGDYKVKSEIILNKLPN